MTSALSKWLVNKNRGTLGSGLAKKGKGKKGRKEKRGDKEAKEKRRRSEGEAKEKRRRSEGEAKKKRKVLALEDTASFIISSRAPFYLQARGSEFHRI
jgi:hypothetical protein